MLDFLILVSVIVLGYFLIHQSRTKEPRKIFDIYSQPGKWYYFKYLLFLLVINLRRLRAKLSKEAIKSEAEKLEKLQQLSDHELLARCKQKLLIPGLGDTENLDLEAHPQLKEGKICLKWPERLDAKAALNRVFLLLTSDVLGIHLAFDAVFFHFVDQKGLYFCCGTERRQKGKICGLIYLVVPEYGVLESLKLPHTSLVADPDSLLHAKTYAAEGLVITPVEPMKRWKVSFKGKMRQQNKPENLVNVDLETEWRSDYPWFLFEVDMPSRILARSIARETWTREYFEALKDAHQTHYEQMGYINGTLKLNGQEYPLKHLDAFRDHSFGFKRDWSLMHRYIYHMFYLENGLRISCGVVCQPCTASYLEMGYINHPDGTIDPIERCDLLLYQVAENGILPKELCFTVTAKWVVYEIKATYLYDSVHYKGAEEEIRMCERFHKCEVNGVPGRGISEWTYNERHMKSN